MHVVLHVQGGHGLMGCRRLSNDLKHVVDGATVAGRDGGTSDLQCVGGTTGLVGDQHTTQKSADGTLLLQKSAV